MENNNAVGIVETFGLTGAIAAVDAAVKASNVKFIGTEFVPGIGCISVRFTGKVSDIQAAVAAAAAACNKVTCVRSTLVIPRPHSDVQKMIDTEETKRSISKNLAAKIEEKEETEEIQEASEPAAEEQTDDMPETEEASEPAAEEQADDMPARTQGVTCNLCRDPRCNRKPGQLHKFCLHYSGK